MVIQWVKNLAGRNRPVASPAQQPTATVAARGGEPLHYPPVDRGLLLRSADAMLEANGDLIERLRLHAAAGQATFNERYLQPLRRLARHINVLPGSPSGLFSGDLGLFRACVELGFYSFQASDGRIFTGQEKVERRHALEARWRYLCFLGGILYPLGLTLDRVVIADARGAVWKRHFQGLSDWAEQRGCERVFASWGEIDDEASEMGPSPGTSGLVPAIVGAENMQLLEDDAAELVTSLYNLASGVGGSTSIAYQVVTGCWARVEEREKARRPQAFGRLTSGTHQGPYLIGAIRSQLESGRWKVNASPLRADQAGLYLVWPAASAVLIEWGRGHGYAGWPADPATLAELLKAAKVVDAAAGVMGLVEVVDDDGEIHHALKIANPLAIISDFDATAFAAQRGQTLDAVMAADPVAEAERAAAEGEVGKTRAIATERSTPPRKESPRTQPDPAEPAEDTGPVLLERPTAAPAPESVAGPLKEAADVRFADLVPEDIRTALGNALQIELLGKVIKAWRDRVGDSQATLRRVDTGAAIALSFLTSIMRDAPTWIDAMSKVGLIYAPPSTPGLRIHKVAIPEGRPPVQAVILTNMACRRLGL